MLTEAQKIRRAAIALRLLNQEGIDLWILAEVVDILRTERTSPRRKAAAPSPSSVEALAQGRIATMPPPSADERLQLLEERIRSLEEFRYLARLRQRSRRF